MKCETVEVICDNESGYMVINKSDMTKDHVIYEPSKEPEKAESDAKKGKKGKSK